MNEALEPLMTRKQAAEYISLILQVSYRHAYGRYIKMPGFPAAVKVPSATGVKPIERWHKSEIMAWLPHEKQAA